MKYSFFLFFIVLISCGRVQMGGISSNTIGETVSLTAQLITQEDRNRLTQICQALQQKEAALATSVGAQLAFSNAQTDCSGNVTETGNITVSIQQSGTSYVFRRTDNKDFIFSNVETSTVGILAEACGNLAGYTNPTIGSSGAEATFITTDGILNSDCPVASGELCVFVQKGSISNGSATINSKDWMRVRISDLGNSKIGFFTHRKKVSKSFCGTNESVSFSATMK